MTNRHHHAIVIGGSIAGLLAARVLADHFERVTIIERDRLPDGPQLRKGVPQASHVHMLLAQGLQVIESLLPGFGQALASDGAVPVNRGKDFRPPATLFSPRIAWKALRGSRMQADAQRQTLATDAGEWKTHDLPHQGQQSHA